MARIISKCKREKRIDRDRERQMKRTKKTHTHTTTEQLKSGLGGRD